MEQVIQTVNTHYRDAKISDLDSINELVRISKGYWGYSEWFLDKYMERYTITPSYLKSNTLQVMLVNDIIIAVCAFIKDEQGLVLDFFFMHPDYIGKGFGKKLWRHACQLAKKLSNNGFRLISDPNAEAFYLKAGCKQVGRYESLIISGRYMPIMYYPNR